MTTIKNAEHKKVDMLNGPFFCKMLFFAFPLMLTGILQIVYNAADIIVVGQFAGKESLAAVGSTAPLINLIVNLFLGFATGTGVVTANLIGAEDDDALKKSVHTAMLFSVVCGCIVGVFGVVSSRSFLWLMGSPEDVIDLSALYLKIYFLGTPASMIYNFGAAVIRSNGDTKRPLIILGFSGIVNVVLNLVLITVFSLGVAGVAIATVVAQYISAFFIVRKMTRLTNACRLSFGELRFHKKQLKRIVTIGLPAGFQSMMFSLSNVVIQATVNSFGSIAVAGCSAATNIDNFIFVCSSAISQTAMTFTSQNMGAGRYKNVSRIYWRCMLMTSVLNLLLMSVALVFSQQILRMFSNDADVIQMGIERTNMVVKFYVMCGMMDLAGSQIRGMGRSFEAMLITLVGSCGIRVLWIYMIFPFNPSLSNVFLAYPVSWTITFVTLQICYAFLNRKICGRQNTAEQTINVQ